MNPTQAIACLFFLMCTPAGYTKKEDGGGSSFIFHGAMQPFTVDHCDNILIRNVIINWDIPLTA